MSRTQEDIQNELVVLECQDGDGRALSALIARWQPRFVRLAWRLTADREAARDLVQDAWLAIVRGINRLDDPARFRAWAYRIVSNKCVDWTRRRVVQRMAVRDIRTAEACGPNESPHNLESDDHAASLRDALSKLPMEQGAMLSLHYLDGMGIAEIARVFELPVGTVKSRMHHARNELRQALERVET